MKRKIKIMEIIPNLGLAGAEIMLENLVTELSKDDDKFDVSVISLYNYHSVITERLEYQGIPIFYLGKKKGFDIRIIFRLYKLFKKEKPDVVHTHLYVMPYVIPATIFAKLPIRIHTVHSIAEKESGKLRRKINKLFYKYCNVIPVAISPVVKRSIIQEYKLASDRVPVIYNGIDLNKCIPKTNYFFNSENIIILHIGRFAEPKNHAGLIESFKIVHDKVPNTVLKLIGAGDLEQVIKNKVKQLGLKDCVEFLGLKANVYQYLNEADIFVLPSLWEGMPITLIEAMATGLPIVATKVGGIPDMIEDNVTGLLVDVNKEKIAEALLKLIYDSSLRQKLGTAARLYSQRYSVQEMKKQYVKLYKECMNNLSADNNLR